MSGGFRFADTYSLHSLFSAISRRGEVLEQMLGIFGIEKFCWNVKVYQSRSEMLLLADNTDNFALHGALGDRISARLTVEPGQVEI